MSMNADEISELDGDFDREKEVQLDRRNEAVENYMTIEFVAIPPDFDILAYLSLREQAGIFKTKNVDLKQLQVIADGVRMSPVFSMLNNIRIDRSTCLYFLKVIHELDLVLKTVYNPMRTNIDAYLEQFETSRSVWIRGQEAKTVNFTIINLFNVMSQEVVDEAMAIAKKLQDEQTATNERLESMDNL